MQHSLEVLTGAFIAREPYQKLNYTAGAAGDPNLQFFRQTFQQPLQFGLPGYEQRHASCTTVVKTHSSTSTTLWPSDDQYITSSNSSGEVVMAIAEMLPFRDFRQLTELENRIEMVQQYENLISNLQILMLRHKGSLSDMLRNFIADPVLGRIGFARTKNGKYDCAMRSDLPRIMMAIKASWFPTLDQASFDQQMAQLLKNAHSRCKTKINEQNDVLLLNDPATVKNQKDSANIEYQSQGTKSQVPPASSLALATPQDNSHAILQNQWYRYAVYYRDRYQVARKANQKMKADYAEQEAGYQRRISACLKHIRSMVRYMDKLEEQLQRLE